MRITYWKEEKTMSVAEIPAGMLDHVAEVFEHFGVKAYGYTRTSIKVPEGTEISPTRAGRISACLLALYAEE